MKTNPLIRLAQTAYTLLIRFASWLQSPLLLVVRLYWGWAFFQAGNGKLMNLEQTTAFFTELHLPMPGVNAFLAGTTECVGGALLLLGLAARLASVPLIFTMIVAYLTAENEALKSISSDPEKFLGADPFLFLFASVLVLVFGPGALSLDRLIGRVLFRSRNDGAANTSPQFLQRVASSFSGIKIGACRLMTCR
jgi:putative oxidoreductase